MSRDNKVQCGVRDGNGKSAAETGFPRVVCQGRGELPANPALTERCKIYDGAGKFQYAGTSLYPL